MRVSLFVFIFLAVQTQAQDTLRCGHESVYIGYDVWWDKLPEDCEERGFERANPAMFKGKQLKAYKRITDYMEERGGASFLQKLELKSVKVNVNAGRCKGIHFIMKYHFIVSPNYFYRFALFFDKKGRLVGDHKFPDQSDISGFWNLISVCKAVDEAVKIRALNRPISKVELRYDQEAEKFIWVILGRPQKRPEKDVRNRPTGNYIHEYQVLPIDALTGDTMKMRSEEQLVKGGLTPKSY